METVSVNLNLLIFLTKSIKNWQYKKLNKNKLPDVGPKQLKKGSLAGYVKAVEALQTVQAVVHGNTNPSARGILIKNPY